VLSLAQEILQGNATARQDELAAARKYLEQLEMDMIELIQRLPESQQDIRAIRYIHMLHEYFQLLGWLESWQREMQAYQPTPWLKQEVERLEQSVRAFLQLVDPTQALTPLGEEELNQTYTKIKRAYEEFKRGVYARLRHHELQVEQMESLIARANYARLIALTARKAYHWMNAKIDELAPPETDINGEKKEKN
jgi:CHASE3 domain sensor protein